MLEQGSEQRDWRYVATRALERLAQTNQDSALAAKRDTTLVRLFHGRGKTHPGFDDVTVDLLGDVIVIALFAEEDLSVVQLGKILQEELAGNAASYPTVNCCIRQLRRGRQTEAVTLWGEMSERTVGHENGLRFRLHPQRNQNVGLFLDAAPLRSWVRANAENKKVLNLFAYTCGFSVAAIAGGARQVVNNDMSRPALDWGKENHALNGHPERQVAYLPHNLFKTWGKIRQFGPYEMVIIDPPTNQRGSFNAEKQYGGVLKQVAKVMAPGSIAAICLNSPFLDHLFLENQIARWLPKAKHQQWLPSSTDFPEAEPERALKVGLYRL